MIGGEESAFGVSIPDDRAACATVHEVAALHVAEPHIIIAPYRNDVGFTLDRIVVRFLSDNDVWDAKGLADDLGRDVRSTLSRVEMTVEVGLEKLTALDAVVEREAQNQRVGLFPVKGEGFQSGVDVRRHVHRGKIGVSVSYCSGLHREGGRVVESGGALDFIIQHELIHAELGRNHFCVKEVAHLLLHHVVHAFFVAVFAGLVGVPLELLFGFVVGASSATKLALFFKEFALADFEFWIATDLTLAAVNGQEARSDVVFFLVDGFHQKSGDVLPWNGICSIVCHSILPFIDCYLDDDCADHSAAIAAGWSGFNGVTSSGSRGFKNISSTRSLLQKGTDRNCCRVADLDETEAITFSKEHIGSLAGGCSANQGADDDIAGSGNINAGRSEFNRDMLLAGQINCGGEGNNIIIVHILYF